MQFDCTMFDNIDAIQLQTVIIIVDSILDCSGDNSGQSNRHIMLLKCWI